MLMVALSEVMLVCSERGQINEVANSFVVELVEIGVVVTVVNKPLNVLATCDDRGTSLILVLTPGFRLSERKTVVFFLVPLHVS